LAADRAILVGLIINELVSNAGKYAYPDHRGKARGDIDAVAHQVAVALLDNIAEMDADAELDATYIGGEAANVATLRRITNTVLHVADSFLAEVTDEAVEAAEQRRHRR
jgi:two-component sensor histidine kinase